MKVQEYYKWDKMDLELLKELAHENEFFEKVQIFLIPLLDREISEMGLRRERYLQEAKAAFIQEQDRRKKAAAEVLMKPIRLG